MITFAERWEMRVQIAKFRTRSLDKPILQLEGALRNPPKSQRVASTVLNLESASSYLKPPTRNMSAWRIFVEAEAVVLSLRHSLARALAKCPSLILAHKRSLCLSLFSLRHCPCQPVSIFVALALRPTLTRTRALSLSLNPIQQPKAWIQTLHPSGGCVWAGPRKRSRLLRGSYGDACPYLRASHVGGGDRIHPENARKSG